jgi:transcriptional regulator
VYNPAVFRETRPEVLAAAIAKHPLATLISVGSEGIDATHLPLLYLQADAGAAVLRGHFARANPHWTHYAAGTEALAIFGGPEHYVTPGWYPSTREHGKVVPTWNYVTVHVRGKLTFFEDPEWLRANVSALTDAQERASEHPWRVSDAPADFIEKQLGAIVGVEMAISRMEGKWKLSQNRIPADHDGVVQGLEKLDSDAAREMSRIMKGEKPI